MGDGQDRREASASLCVQPCEHPRGFHLLVDPQRAIRVRNEIAEAVDATESTMHRRVVLEGEILGQLRRAAEGKLRLGLEDGDVLEPVRRNPDLWEIKWKKGKRGELRLYHAEPGADPSFVGLRFHRKSTAGNAAAIAAAQNDEMDEAGRRYADGVKVRWGHATDCADCLHP